MKILRQAAGFYDLEIAAFRMIQAHYCEGQVYSSEGSQTVDDFYRSQARAYALRAKSGARHTLCALEFAFEIAGTHGNVTLGSLRCPRNLDDIESVRDFEGQYKARYGKFERR